MKSGSGFKQFTRGLKHSLFLFSRYYMSPDKGGERYDTNDSITNIRVNTSDYLNENEGDV